MTTNPKESVSATNRLDESEFEPLLRYMKAFKNTIQTLYLFDNPTFTTPDPVVITRKDFDFNWKPLNIEYDKRSPEEYHSPAFLYRVADMSYQKKLFQGIIEHTSFKGFPDNEVRANFLQFVYRDIFEILSFIIGESEILDPDKRILHAINDEARNQYFVLLEKWKKVQI